ncbi:hypothetical protein LLG90_00695 [Aromatoleum toluclasticum]|uniref:hypothetical protein n=1 Tax=Aromatoleum toluclasticum TaxID=92003 RepID=UPI001D18ACC1|nr:hypothetical protein [Aromatoleum toluclasticum]MCC4113861.1 hypothetical protein [Aromatoleum toluclasticum]
MAARITDEEWDKLSLENFETHSLLRAVDAVDELRDDLNDGEYATPPQLRTDLLKLHQLAMAVINEGSRSQVADRFELAGGLDGDGWSAGGSSYRRQARRNATAPTKRPAVRPSWPNGRQARTASAGLSN